MVQLLLTYGAFYKRDNLQTTSNKMMYKRTDSEELKSKRENRWVKSQVSVSFTPNFVGIPSGISGDFPN